ncbi:MAG TPA: tetratricopeptide repeat protein [Syntrophales bacterium]|nr:tetratricopeptide repeat protein [Syntrophobacterales bacterium]HQL91089.1 tetratricopeptide repeat protein [Syntrophales bacterium]
MKKSILLLVVLILAGCAVPKIVILDDPLTAQQHNDLGVAYEEKGDFGLAEKEYEKALKKNREWVIPYLNLGHLYYRQDQLDRAENILREGLRAKGDHPDLLNNLAWVLMEKGRLEHAQYLIDKAIAIEDKEEYRDTRREILERMKEK